MVFLDIMTNKINLEEDREKMNYIPFWCCFGYITCDDRVQSNEERVKERKKFSALKNITIRLIK